MSTKTIPLKAVSDALYMAVMKQTRARLFSDGNPQARTAAFTDLPSSFGSNCSNKRRRQSLQPIHCGFMDHGSLGKLVDRVHCDHGPQEVRRIWGIGVRDMKAEIGTGSLR